MLLNPYDLVPYGNHPHPQTHPDRLCAVGRLFGLEAPDPRRARVLELGCASGGNLIPMAFQLPEARFLGIDLSGEQIASGRELVEELGLGNIELEHRSIADLGAEAGEFDYVICHGVYSWVPEEVRRKILEICRDRLTPQGVAFVSYNTLPGWNMVRSVRDMMLYHAGRAEEPAERALQARELLRFLGAGSGDRETPYGAFLAAETELLESVDATYLLHDHLAEVNQPFYFHEVMAAARRHDLEYLADSDLASMLPENLADPIAEKLREIDDIVRMEQYMDFVRNRRFRGTLLCHAGIPLRRRVASPDLKRFLIAGAFTSPMAIEPRHLEEGVELSFLLGQNTIHARGRVAKAALAVLAGTGGVPMGYEELVERTAATADVEDRQRVRQLIDQDLDLSRLLFANAIRIHTLPVPYATEIGERPAVSRLVRHEARRGLQVTNQRHEAVVLQPADRVVVQYLAGTLTIPKVSARLVEHLEKGDLEIVLDGKTVDPTGPVEEPLLGYCHQLLARLADNALLVDADGAEPDSR